MFFSTDGIHHDALWEKWFLSNSDAYYEDIASIYVHANDTDSLRISPTLTPFFEQRVIPSVKTEYYKNLFDAMIQLLIYAHADVENTHFVFISDSSIPLMTLDEVHTELANDEKSRFCLRSNERAHWVWSRFPQLDMPDEYHRESEMWSSLSRDHVTQVINHLNSDLMVWQRANTARNRGPAPWAGAPDETFLPTFLTKVIGTAEAFNTCHKTVTETKEEDSMDGPYMGCCPTWVEWSDGPPRHEVQIDNCVSTGVSSPCMYEKVGIEDMRSLHDKGYLFMRKVAKNAVLVSRNGAETSLLDNHPTILSTNRKLKMIK